MKKKLILLVYIM